MPTPGWSGWAARRCPSHWATWCSCPGCARRAPTRWPSGWPSWPTTTGRTGTGRTRAWRRRRARRARGGGAGGGAGLAAIGERLADDLDAPGALAIVDAWADAVQAGAAAADGRLVRDAVDALLGIAL